MKLTGGEIVVRALEDEGIVHTFGIPGTHNTELYDALGPSKVTPVLVTDEQSAGFMADGYWRASGRVRGDVTVRPGGGTRVAVRFKDETRENELTFPLALPTAVTPPATAYGGARFDLTAWGATIGWERGERVDLEVGYDRTELSSDADLVYVTGFTFFPGFDVFTTLDSNRHVSDQDAIHGRVCVGVGAGVSLTASASLMSNDGTFPVDWNVYGAEARWQHGSGIHVRLAFDRYQLDETNPYAGDPAAPTPDVNDYDADLWTLGLGYQF